MTVKPLQNKLKQIKRVELRYKTTVLREWTERNGTVGTRFVRNFTSEDLHQVTV